MNWENPTTWEALVPVLTPQINAAGVHIWPFDPSFPIDVRFYITGGHQNIRMNRHDYMELMYICDGSSDFRVQDRSFPVAAGDLIVVSSGLYHGIVASPQVKIVALYFEPELIRVTDTTGEHIEYLTPFLIQGPAFPHVVN